MNSRLSRSAKLGLLVVLVFAVAQTLLLGQSPNDEKQKRIKQLMDAKQAHDAKLAKKALVTLHVGATGNAIFTEAARVFVDRGMDGLAGTVAPPDLVNRLQQRPKMPLTVNVGVSGDESLPAWDLRKKIPDMPVRNQNPCNNCWIFGAIGAFEGNFLFQKTLGQDVDASEQYVVNCLERGQDNCGQGGWPSIVFDFLISKGTRARSEPGMAYEGRMRPCDAAAPTKFKAVKWKYVNENTPIPSNQELKRALVEFGALAVAVKSTPAFVIYPGDVFDDEPSDANSRSFTKEMINHAVVLIGWDDAKEASNGRKGAWLVRNSWGPSWGGTEKGHVWIAFDNNNIGFGAMYVQATGDAVNPTPDKKCPCPARVVPNYNEEINSRINYWMKTPFAFPTPK